MAEQNSDTDHWLVRPGTIRRLWIISIAVLIVTVLFDLAIQRHPSFGIDGTFGFGAWFGFVSCVIFIVFSKALGALLKRPDTYYDG